MCLCVCRAEIATTVYRENAAATVDANAKKKSSLIKLAKAQRELENFQKRESSVQELRRANHALTSEKRKLAEQLAATIKAKNAAVRR